MGAQMRAPHPVACMLLMLLATAAGTVLMVATLLAAIGQ